MSTFSIDRQFARFGSTRYATDKITSFTVKAERRRVQGSNDRFSAILVGSLGVIIGFGVAGARVSSGNPDQALMGFGLLAGGGWLLWKAKGMAASRTGFQTVFKLLMVTNAGEVAAFETTSSDEMSEVEAALEQAILDARR